jgi:hypothetical protein
MKGEKLEKDLKTKKVYHFVDTEAGIDQLSKEVYKNKDLEVHYPRGFAGGQKYKTIKRISFLGFKEKLPIGMVKSPFYGYGFTKTLGPFAKYIDDNFKFVEIIIEKGGSIEIDESKKVLYLNEIALHKLNSAFATVFSKNKSEVQAVLQSALYDLFPNEVKEPEAKYIKNALSQSLATWGNSIDEFSEQDKEAIANLFESLSSSTDFLTAASLKSTKEIVDVRLIEKALSEFDELYTQSSDTKTLEKKWQAYLKDNSWIFSSVFAQPVILFHDEAYAGGKSVDNKNGKYTDFLVKNSLSDNVAFFEIKTHKTKLLEDKPYRGNDVFSTSKELAGCVNQVLNQRDKFQKSYSVLKIESDEEFESCNPSCFVLVGSLRDLTKKQKYCFELFRSNNRDVEIVTFDEVKRKIEMLRSLIAG